MPKTDAASLSTSLAMAAASSSRRLASESFAALRHAPARLISARQFNEIVETLFAPLVAMHCCAAQSRDDGRAIGE